VSAIQKAEQQGLERGFVHWDRERIELCKRTICPKGITDDEFTLFIEQCKASGLNPFLKEAYCVPRKTKMADGSFVTVHTFQSGVEGLRARAGRFPGFQGSTSAAVREKDECEVDVDAGVVRHKFKPTQQRGRIVGAWAKVNRDGQSIVVWLDVTARSGQSQFWRDDPGGMLAKCAEVAALKKAYPTQFTGVDTREEAIEEREPSRLEQAIAGQPVAQQTPALPPPLSGPKVEFGPMKGRLLETLTFEECDAALGEAQQLMAAANPKAKWLPKMEANVAAIRERKNALWDAAMEEGSKDEVTDAEFRDAEKADILAKEKEEHT